MNRPRAISHPDRDALEHHDLCSPHDQIVAEDTFTAMQRVEQRLEIVPAKQNDIEVVTVQEPED
jgi:hypothetical protein